MLDWSKIDNEKKFQRLVNHLFALECNSPGFIPSSPYIGADGGWDGWHQGYYPYDNLNGLYSIQSKWTTKSHKEAVKHLKKEIGKELIKAKENNVEHLRIATNAELKVEQINSELKSLNQGEVNTLEIWHREDLTLRIERQPFLCSYFFGKLLYPVFIPSNTYFENPKIEPHLTDFTGTEIESFKHYFNEFVKFVLSEKERFFIIHAPGGYGKSHFIKELAELSHRTDSNRQPWLTRLGMKKLEDAIQQEIVPDRKYLLIVDDVDRDLVELIPLIAFATKVNIDLKVVLSLRSAGIYLLRDVISNSGLSPITAQLQINNWRQEELIILLRLVVNHDPNKVVKDEELIAGTYPNPYLIVEFGRLIKGEGFTGIQKLKSKFVDDVTTDTKRALKGLYNGNDLQELISVIASMIPFYTKDQLLLSKVYEEFKIDHKDFMKILNRLIETGILREIGRKVRFNPDMKGDFYLQNYIEQTRIDDLETFILNWIEVNPLNLFLNVGSASRYGETNKTKMIVKRIISGWINNAGNTTKDGKSKILSYLEKIVFIVPEESINLLCAYLEIDEKSKKNQSSLDESTSSLSTDAYGNVLLELKKIPSIRKIFLDIIEQITRLGISGTYYNYKPSTLITKCVSPLENKLEVILSTIEIFDQWLVKPTNERVLLLESALKELLAGANHYERYKMGTLEWGSVPLKNESRVIALRDTVLSILTKMIRHECIEVQCAGVRIAWNIGQDPMGRDGDEKLPLHDRFAEEREQVINELRLLLKTETDYRVLNEIEYLCLQWWALKKPGTFQVSKLLRELPQNPEYIIFKYHAAKYFVENYAELESEAPEVNRWTWFVSRTFGYENYKGKDTILSNVTAELNKKYKTPNKIRDYLIELDSFLPTTYEQGIIRRHYFLRNWVLINSKAFMKIRDDAYIWESIPNRFKDEIDTYLSSIYQDHIHQLAGEIFDSLQDVPSERLQSFLRIMVDSLPNNQSLEYIKKLAKMGNPFIKANIVFYLKPIFDKTNDLDGILVIITDIISDESGFSDLLIAKLSDLPREFSIEFKVADQSKIINIRKQILKQLKKRSNVTYYSNNLLSFCVEDIDELLSYIDYRLKIAQELPYTSGFQPIPYEGYDVLKQKTTDYVSFKKFMQKLNEWHESDYFLIADYMDYLFKPLRQKEGIQESYLIKYIKELLAERKIKEAIITIERLSLKSETIDMFIEVSEKGINEGYYDDISSLYKSRIYNTEFSWIKSPEHIAENESKIKLLEGISNRSTSARLKIIISSCIDVIKREIDVEDKYDEEIFNPRG